MSTLNSTQVGNELKVSSANFCHWAVEKLHEKEVNLDQFLHEDMNSSNAHSQKVNTFQEYDFQLQVSAHFVMHYI